MRGECGLYRQMLVPSFLPEVGQNMQWMDVHIDVALTTVPIFGISCLCLQWSLVRSHLVSLEFFIDLKSFRSHYGPGVDSASNRNEYQEHFLGVKAAGA